MELLLREPLGEPLALNVTEGLPDKLGVKDTVAVAVEERHSVGDPDTDMVTLEVRH